MTQLVTCCICNSEFVDIVAADSEIWVNEKIWVMYLLAAAVLIECDRAAKTSNLPKSAVPLAPRLQIKLGLPPFIIYVLNTSISILICVHI